MSGRGGVGSLRRAPRRIVVSRTDRIGDLLLALPVFESLRASFPGARLTALVSSYAREVVERHPCVDEVWALSGGESLADLVRGFRERVPEAALFLFPRPRLALAAALAGVPLRVGTAYRWYSFLFNRQVAHHRSDSVRHEADYNLDLLGPLGARRIVRRSRLLPPREAHRRAEVLLAQAGIGPRGRLVAVHPGHGGSNLNWPPDRYGAAAARISRLPGVRVVLTGGPGEGAILEKTRRAACSSGFRGSLPCFAGVLRLPELSALYSRCACLLSGSTGVMHLAAAVGCPTVSLFGRLPSTTPVRWGPLGNRSVVLQPAPRPGEREDGAWSRDPRSMERVSVDEVVRAVKAILRRNTKSAPSKNSP